MATVKGASATPPTPGCRQVWPPAARLPLPTHTPPASPASPLSAFGTLWPGTCGDNDMGRLHLRWLDKDGREYEEWRTVRIRPGARMR